VPYGDGKVVCCMAVDDLEEEVEKLRYLLTRCVSALENMRDADPPQGDVFGVDDVIAQADAVLWSARYRDATSAQLRKEAGQLRLWR